MHSNFTRQSANTDEGNTKRLTVTIPTGGFSAIDLTYLSSKTQGNRSLETELLVLFKRQSQKISHELAADEIDTITRSLPGYRARLAETLKGSADAVGAWRIKQAAAELAKISAQPGEKAKLKPALAELQEAVSEANLLIGELLAA